MVPNNVPARRTLVLGIVGVCAFLVLIGALLPGPRQRQIAGKRHRLDVLTRIVTPAPGIPTVSFVWKRGRETPEGIGREVRIHAYLRLGIRTRRTDLLGLPYFASGSAQGATAIHLSFDPKLPDELRIATALAATPNEAGGGLRREALLLGSRAPARLMSSVATVQAQVGVEGWRRARERALSSLADDRATGHPRGTVLYEVDGRYYAEPSATARTPKVPWTGISTDDSEILEALCDPDVPLP